MRALGRGQVLGLLERARSPQLSLKRGAPIMIGAPKIYRIVKFNWFAPGGLAKLDSIQEFHIPLSKSHLKYLTAASRDDYLNSLRVGDLFHETTWHQILKESQYVS